MVDIEITKARRMHEKKKGGRRKRIRKIQIRQRILRDVEISRVTGGGLLARV
jgi:hypothetical protein